MAEWVNGVPVEVWECLQARFPGTLRLADPPKHREVPAESPGHKDRFTCAVSRSLRIEPPSLEGLLVDAMHLLPVLRCLRDEFGYVYLSNLTAVDYPEATDQLPPHIDVVYHLFQLEGGGYLPLHIHASRKGTIIPSIVSEFLAANLQEREVWDMFGVRFEGHPDLRRLLLWEGFEGFPLRKDWHEAYYEEEHKPFRSRFPGGGNPSYAEDRMPRHVETGLAHQASSDSCRSSPVDLGQSDQLLYERLLSADRNPDSPLKRGETILDIVSQFNSAYGLFRAAVRLEGETIRHLEPVFGYLHRNHEKIGERNTWLQNIPYTGRLDATNGMTCNLAYCLAMEKLLGWEVPERAEYIRVILSELSRIANHLLAASRFSSALGMDATSSFYALKEREPILDLFEMCSGARGMYNYMRPGGVAHDLPSGWVERARAWIHTRLPRRVDQMESFLMDNEIVKTRSEGLAVLTGAEAIASGVSGPVLRASGVPYDVRRAEPYGIYERFEFEVATCGQGDAYARMALRFDEIRQSLRILEQALDQIPNGSGDEALKSHRLSPTLHIPPGETYGRIETPRGELGFYLVSDGGANPYRYHIRSASLLNLTPLSHLTQGVRVADLGAILAGLDLSMGEVDR